MAHPLSFMRKVTVTFIMFLSLLIGLLRADQGLDFAKINAYLLKQYGQVAYKRGLYWQQLMHDHRNASPQTQLEIVNNFFNELSWRDDIEVWQQKDYWATPVEFLGRGMGDCEDYTLAKYFSLVEMGFPADKLRLMYVKAVKYNQHHMVLTYYPKKGAEPWVLDNIDPEIKRAGKRGDLLPIYSFNANYLWLAKARGGGKLVGGSERLSLWQDILNRQSEYTLLGSDTQENRSQ